MAFRPRRCLQFSLRTFLLVVSALGCWLGWQVQRAERQKNAAEKIEALGGLVVYEHELDSDGYPIDFKRHLPPGPAWLRRLLGDHLFQRVAEVYFGDQAKIVDDDLLHLRDLPGLKRVFLMPRDQTMISERAIAELRRCLPRCEVEDLPSGIEVEPSGPMIVDPPPSADSPQFKVMPFFPEEDPQTPETWKL